MISLRKLLDQSFAMMIFQSFLDNNIYKIPILELPIDFFICMAIIKKEKALKISWFLRQIVMSNDIMIQIINGF